VSNENPTKRNVYDQYQGKDVLIQLRDPFQAVTAPGVPAQRPRLQNTPEGVKPVVIDTPNGPQQMMEPVFTQIIPGECEVVKDDYGNVRIRIKYNDPDPDSRALVCSEFSPEDIFAITVVHQPSKIALA